MLLQLYSPVSGEFAICGDVLDLETLHDHMTALLCGEEDEAEAPACLVSLAYGVRCTLEQSQGGTYNAPSFVEDGGAHYRRTNPISLAEAVIVYAIMAKGCVARPMSLAVKSSVIQFGSLVGGALARAGIEMPEALLNRAAGAVALWAKYPDTDVVNTIIDGVFGELRNAGERQIMLQDLPRLLHPGAIAVSSGS